MSAPTPTTQDQGGGSKARDAAAAAQQSGQQVAGTAAEHARDLGGSASEKAAEVVSEAGDKARDLLGQTREQVSTEAENRRGQAVSTLRSLGDELDSMQSHEGEQGWATELAGRGSSYVRQTADWLDNRDPSQILDDVRSFARRKPGTFLLGALVAGVLAGRMTRAVKAGAPSGGSSSGVSSAGGSSAGGGSLGYPTTGYSAGGYGAETVYGADSAGGQHEAAGQRAGSIASSSPVHTAGVAYDPAPEFPAVGDPIADDLTTPLPTRTDGTL